MTHASAERAAPMAMTEIATQGVEPTPRPEARMERVPSSDAISGIDGIASPGMLRDAALTLDQAHRNLGRIDTERAVLVWEGLLRGRVSLVDWFDSNGRRFVLVRLNPAPRSGGCGLTDREYQVAMGAALGESSKVTGYRLDISPSRVSALLKGSMRKLGVKTKAQLVMMVRVLGQPSAQTFASLDNA